MQPMQLPLSNELVKKPGATNNRLWTTRCAGVCPQCGLSCILATKTGEKRCALFTGDRILVSKMTLMREPARWGALFSFAGRS